MNEPRSDLHDRKTQHNALVPQNADIEIEEKWKEKKDYLCDKQISPC